MPGSHADTIAASDVASLVMRIPDLVSADAHLVQRGRYLSTDIMIQVDDVPFHCGIRDGKLGPIARGPILMRSWSFAVRGSSDGWRRHWTKFPEPPYHDLFGLTKFCGFKIDGDMYPLMANLFYFKDVFSVPRKLSGT